MRQGGDQDLGGIITRESRTERASWCQAGLGQAGLFLSWTGEKQGILLVPHLSGRHSQDPLSPMLSPSLAAGTQLQGIPSCGVWETQGLLVEK